MNGPMIEILTHSYATLCETLKQDYGRGPVEARAIMRQVWRRGNTRFFEDPTLAQRPGFAERLEADIDLSLPEVIDRTQAEDTVKLVFRLADGERVESVLVPMAHYTTICVSSQVGCRMGCAFCQTGTLGLVRQLSVSEIVSQIYWAQKVAGAPIRNVVFMGMGEPLLNTENVFRTIELLSAKEFLNFSARRFTISTAGVIKGINGLIDFNKKVNLAVSLNSPFQKEREKIMPVAKNNPLNSLYIALKKYNEKCGRFTFEYIILPGVNNSEKHAKAIISLKKDLNFNVNIIAYNDFPGAEYKKCTSKDINAFLSYFKNSNVEAVKRVSKGADILAACGQLAGKK